MTSVTAGASSSKTRTASLTVTSFASAREAVSLIDHLSTIAHNVWWTMYVRTQVGLFHRRPVYGPRECCFLDLRSCNKMSQTGGCYQTVHYDSYTDHRGVEPVRQRESELTAAEAADSQASIHKAFATKYLPRKLQYEVQ